MQGKLDPAKINIEKLGSSVRARIRKMKQNTEETNHQPSQLNNNIPDVQTQLPSPQNAVQQPAEKIYRRKSYSAFSDFHQALRKDTEKDDRKNVRFHQQLEGESPLVQKPNKSILKRSRFSSPSKGSMKSLNSHAGLKVSRLSAKQSIKDEGAPSQNKKYTEHVMYCKAKNKKFFDQLFPPKQSALFYNKRRARNYEKIRWARIEDVFKGKNITLGHQNSQNLTVSLNESDGVEELSYVASSFTALTSSPRALERIFQNQQYNPYGIYYLRINHEGIWKYVLVDDFIPVRVIGQGNQSQPHHHESNRMNRSNSVSVDLRGKQKPKSNEPQAPDINHAEGKFQPAFISVVHSQHNKRQKIIPNGNTKIRQKLTGSRTAHLKQSDEIKIWPFLLLKAFAKIYSCYDCLLGDSATNFLYQLTGAVGVLLSPQSEFFELAFRKRLTEPNTIILAQNPKKSDKYKGKIYSLSDISKGKSIIEQKKLKLKCSQFQKKPIQQTKEADIMSVLEQFSQFINFSINESYFSVGCGIKQAKDAVSIRKIELNQRSSCQLSVIQRDKKYFPGVKYDYSWVRLILCMQEHGGSYRWIKGMYSREKILSFECELEAGNYLVLIMVDWKGKPQQITLNYQGTWSVTIARKEIKQHPSILTQLYNDLVLRFGHYCELSKHVCSYRYIHREAGLIVQNIRNESTRDMFYFRKYNIPNQSPSCPKDHQKNGNWSNKQTGEPQQYEILSSEINKQNELQAFMDPLGQYTFILQLKNGLSAQFMDSFDFGFSG